MKWYWIGCDSHGVHTCVHTNTVRSDWVKHTNVQFIITLLWLYQWLIILHKSENSCVFSIWTISDTHCIKYCQGTSSVTVFSLQLLLNAPLLCVHLLDAISISQLFGAYHSLFFQNSCLGWVWVGVSVVQEVEQVVPSSSGPHVKVSC